jgi:hypothetical protein
MHISISTAMAGTRADQSAEHVRWRLTDESSCTIETVSQAPNHSSLHLSVSRTVADIKEIRVEATKRDTALEVWTNAGPYDSRTVVANNPGELRIQVDLLQQKHVPVLKRVSPDAVVLVCGKMRLTVQTS